MTESIQQQKQLIDSLIQNLDYETNPNCMQDLYEIRRQIFTYWQVFKDHKYDIHTHKFNRE